MQIKTIISFFTASQNCQKHPNSKHGHSRYIPLLVHDAPYLAGPPLHLLAIGIGTGKKLLVQQYLPSASSCPSINPHF